MYQIYVTTNAEVQGRQLVANKTYRGQPIRGVQEVQTLLRRPHLMVTTSGPYGTVSYLEPVK